MKSKSSIFILAFFILLLTSCFALSCAKQPPATSHVIPTTYPFQKLSGFSQVRVERKGKVEFFDAAFKIIAPNQLQLKILDDFGEERLSLTADGNQVVYSEGAGGKKEKISQEGEALQKSLHLPLTVEEFIARMLDTQSPTYERLENNKKLKYRVSYRQYSLHSKVEYPQQIEWEFRKPKVKILMNLSEIEID